jgi:hypothetical protein
LTIQVNRKRESIENTIINLQLQITEMTSKQKDMRDLTQTISQLKSDQIGTQDKIYVTYT